VGQGGFHTCTIRVGDSKFEYVYDCGSIQTRALAREMAAYSEEIGAGRTIELLSISHLHHDHVSGLEDLLGNHDVDTILLPYLHPWERLVLVAEACAVGRLTEPYLSLLEDPSRWFGRRGGGRVVLVLGPGADGPPEVRPPRPMPADGVRKHDKPVDLFPFRQATDRDVAENPGLTAESEVVRAGDVLSVVVGHLVAWELVPYTHPEPSALAPFAKLVAGVLGLPSLARAPGPRYLTALKKALQNKKRRAALGAAYRAINADMNLTSLCLYSGPAWTPTQGMFHRYSRTRRHWVNGDLRPGWIGTGDTNLSDPARAAGFAKCLGPMFPHVGSVVVPHHGARNFFSITRLGSELNSIDWVISYGKNGYGHPWPPLVSALSRRGGVVRVRERPSAVFEEFVRVE
jgi:glyoxylase-like metal-dependent hydrolase (beta-lactamase superfamily II)